MKPKILQIVTGGYSFINQNTQEKGYSHNLYGIDDKGDIWKWIFLSREWRKIEECLVRERDNEFLKKSYLPD